VVAQVEWATNSSGAVVSRKVVYLHDDNLASIDSISGTGTTTAHLKYDPFGRRIDPLDPTKTAQAPVDLTDGFTDQQHDDELGLINMQGRIYDPGIGRFLSADPFVPAPRSSQGFNRYSYVFNNPLGHTDPNGFGGRGTTTGLYVKGTGPNCATPPGYASACPNVPGGGPEGNLSEGPDPNAPPNSESVASYPGDPSVNASTQPDPELSCGTQDGLPASNQDSTGATPSPSSTPAQDPGAEGAGSGVSADQQAAAAYTASIDQPLQDDPAGNALVGLAAGPLSSLVRAGATLAVDVLEAGANAVMDALASDVAETAPALPQYVYHYTSEATADLIQSGEHLGLEGRTLYLTPNGDLSPTQAGIELALPQTNTAGAVFRVDTSALDPANISMVRQVTGNVLGRGGGGTEILYEGRVPLDAVTRVR
jgi:RHS repeat-associated protein